MSNNIRAEHFALRDAALRPQLTELEIETQVRLADMAEQSTRIAAVPKEERMQRSHDALMLIRQIADVETVRAGVWANASPAVRHICVRSIDLPKARAEDALRKFNAFERGRMWMEIDRLVRELEYVKRALNGGGIDGGTDKDS